MRIEDRLDFTIDVPPHLLQAEFPALWARYDGRQDLRGRFLGPGQNWNSPPLLIGEWRERYRKPVVLDETRYEGDIAEGWGNLTAREPPSPRPGAPE